MAEEKKTRPQDRYDEKNGVKTYGYKLKIDVAEEFKAVCNAKGLKIGPTLTKLMQEFIDQQNTQE